MEAFRATLEEAASSNLLLHVIDAAAEERTRNIEQVEEVLQEIHAGDLPQLKVYNKIDLLESLPPRIDRDDQGKPVAVWLSAQTGAGVELLFDAIAELLGEEIVQQRLRLSPQQGRLRARLYQQNAVLAEEYTDDGSSVLGVRIPKADLLRILSAEQLALEELQWLDDEPRRIAV